MSQYKCKFLFPCCPHITQSFITVSCRFSAAASLHKIPSSCKTLSFLQAILYTQTPGYSWVCFLQMNSAIVKGTDNSCYLEKKQLVIMTLFFIFVLPFSDRAVQSRKDSSSKQNPDLRTDTNYYNVYTCGSPHHSFSTSSAHHLDTHLWVCPVDYVYCSFHHFRQVSILAITF